MMTEEFNLSLGKSYQMSGLPGMKEGSKHAYVPPHFESPDRALTWDWWGQTHAVLPAPNAYRFSLTEGFAPDSPEFSGCKKYSHIQAGDGGLIHTEGRFA